MSMRNVLIIFVILAILGIFSYLLNQSNRGNEHTNSDAASTTETILPGTTSGTSGSEYEIPQSSDEISDDSLQKLTLTLHERKEALFVAVTPTKVIEDSRCPIDVQCIQAGRVRVAVTLESGLGTAHEVFEIGHTITTEAESVTLVEVSPEALSSRPIEDSEYTFVFSVEKRVQP